MSVRSMSTPIAVVLTLLIVAFVMMIVMTATTEAQGNFPAYTQDRTTTSSGF